MRLSRSVHFLLPLALASTSMGQALLIMPNAEDPDLPAFNERFIARNGIAGFVGERMVKRDGEPMLPERERLLFKFDEQGRLVYSNHSYGQPGSGRDTASVQYRRDEHGRVNRRLRNDLGGHFAYALELDDQGRVTRETYQRIENLGTNRYEPIPGLTIEISDERYRYTQVNDTTLRKSFLNNLDLPYRDQVFISNRQGYLLRIEDEYLVSRRRGLIEFSYDENGRLAERTERPDLAQSRITRHRWQYDATGNVISGEYWLGDRQVSRDEYVYEEATMLPKARLRKDLATGNIHVLKLTAARR
jgi:hypothetical protein